MINVIELVLPSSRAVARIPEVNLSVEIFGISAASKVIKLLGTPVATKFAVSLAFVIINN